MSCDTRINFVLIGATSTGKTQYICALGHNPRTSKLDNSFNYIDTVCGGGSPKPTSAGLVTLCFQYKDKTYDTNFKIDDYDGKFAETLQAEKNNKNIKFLIRQIELSEGIMFLFPYEKEEEKQHNRKKYENIQNEIDTILEALKKDEKIYRHRTIPIPIVIAVTKWDNSPDYKKSDENTKVIEYIESDEILNFCYKKIGDYFKHIKILPISSTEGHNIDEPLVFFLEKTYGIWEEEIKRLERDGNNNSLIEYLDDKKNELKGYKEGTFFKQYQKLKRERNKRRLQRLGVFLVLLGILAMLFNNLSFNNKEEKLYIKIDKAYQSSDYSSLHNDIEEYLKHFDNTNKEHFQHIIDLKSKYNVECKTYLNKGLQNLVGYQELQKRIDTLKKMVSTNTSCGQNSLSTAIDDKLKEDKVLQEQYQAAMQLLNVADVSMIDWKQISSILHLIDTLPQRDSEKLRDKLQGLIVTIIASDNEEAIEMIINHEGILTLSEEMNVKLQIRRGSLEIEYSFRELVSEINNHNFVKAASMVETQYRKDFDDEQKKGLSNILQKKFNIETGNILKNQMPGSIRHIDDFHRMKKAFGDIKTMQTNGVVKAIEFTPIMNGENKNAYEQKRKILMGYTVVFSQGFTPSHISFSAYNKNNEPLGFMCNSLDSNDDIILKINNRIYDYDGANCRGTQITYSNRFRYSPGQYFGEVTEVDTIFNDLFSFNIKLNKNDLIKLKNGNSVKKSIGNGYSITWIP